MKRMKPNTTQVAKLLPGGEHGPWFYISTQTGAVRKRWWSKARIPGTVRPSTLPGGSAHHPVKLGARRRAA